MRDQPDSLRHIGVRGAYLVLLWPAVLAGAASPLAARALPADGVAALHTPRGLTTLAAKLDFAARDLQLQPGVEVPLALRLPTEEQLKQAGGETGAFILVRNIPEGLTLSEGMPIGVNWIMSLPQSGRARLLAGAGVAGNHRLEFLLIGPGNRVLAETSVVARLPEPKASAPAMAAAAVEEKPVAALSRTIEPERQEAPPPAAATPSISPEEEAILLAKGAELIGQGGIAGARLIFEELAQQGSSKGALALARTYDPAFVETAPAGSLVADLPKALSWYKRAAQLGSGEATRRLSQLASQR
jgi:hypothetical protein